jgi:type I restriction enzyme S subunit
MLNLNTKILRAVPVSYPERSEQENIAYMLSDLDEKIAIEEDRKAAMQDFFKTMLHQLMRTNQYNGIPKPLQSRHRGSRSPV